MFVGFYVLALGVVPDIAPLREMPGGGRGAGAPPDLIHCSRPHS